MTNNEILAESPFDGIICIGGEDWWYHNRGHFDFQVMRRLARRWPVLFVNSLGVRMPSVRGDQMFASRIMRKLKSLSRGLVEVEPGFSVFSPFVVPGQTGQKLSNWALAPQIKVAAVRMGVRNPLLWVHCPAGASLVAQLDPVGTVLQRTDRFEAFPEADQAVIGAQIKLMRDVADLVVYAAPHLEEEERGAVRQSLLVTHGVDLESFSSAGKAHQFEAGTGAGSRFLPQDVAEILERTSGPLVGFTGGIDRHTFDPELFLEVARQRSECQFVMVGSCSLPEGWCSLENVHFLGRKCYDEIASYMAAMDVLIMPWNDSEWIKACNPIKLKEYLAVGRPIVTTGFRALDGWRDVVRVAADADEFADGITEALAGRTDYARRFDKILGRLALETWDAKADMIAAELIAVAGKRADMLQAA